MAIHTKLSKMRRTCFSYTGSRSSFSSLKAAIWVKNYPKYM